MHTDVEATYGCVRYVNSAQLDGVPPFLRSVLCGIIYCLFAMHTGLSVLQVACEVWASLNYATLVEICNFSVKPSCILKKLKYFLWLLFWKVMLLASSLSLFYLRDSKNVDFCSWSDFSAYLLACP